MQRYKTTSIRDKRSIVRTLKTFSSQYEYILCDSEFVDLNFEPIVLHYRDELNYGKDISFQNIIYSKSEAKIDLQNTKNILDAIDNMISINRRVELKNELKKLVKGREFNNTNLFFSNREISINQINIIIDNIEFSKKLLSQIEHRIIFKRSGIYSTNYKSSTVKSKTIYLTQTNAISILYKELEYVIANLYLFDESTLERVEYLNSYIVNERRNPHYVDDYVPNEHNSSYYHPIDEESYNETGDEAHLTIQQLDQINHGLYNKEIYNEYYSLAYNYNDNVSFVLELIDKLLKFSKKENIVLSKLRVAEDDIYDKYHLFFEKLDSYNYKFKMLMFNNSDNDIFSDSEIKSFKKEIIRFIEETLPYPIEDFTLYYENIDEHTLQEVSDYFNLSFERIDFIIKYK